MITVGILMPVFNKLNYTKKALIALEKQLQEGASTCKYEIIVSDDGSNDGTSEWIAKNLPHVHVLKGDGNLWWSGGVNLGAKYALEECNADYLLLWNNDIIPAEDYLEKISELAIENNKETIIGSKVYFSNQPNLIHAYGCFFNPRTGIKYPYGYEMFDSEIFDKELLCDWLPGMGTLVPSGIVEKLNFWDNKRFPQYHGDSDFTWRAKRAGYVIKVVPQLKLWNNTENTGNNYPTSFKDAYRALTSIRSDYNVKVEWDFYRIHGEGIFWIVGFLQKYFYFTYGFFKRNIKKLIIRKYP